MNNLTRKNLVNSYLQLIKVRKSQIAGSGGEIPRICGYLEACLQNEGVLSSSEELPKKDIEHKNIFGYISTRKENYIDMIIRLCLEFISDNNIDITEYEAGDYRYEIGDYDK